ncbi:hypothetical protein [Pseudomonas sp. RL_5y_Pfl2_73]|uniref:hypothetical protein n=1 Tax=Pseudomonas sp. RL_5y_Pfl2_73 TaxID=3088713 RepID=UPI0030DBC5FF
MINIREATTADLDVLREIGCETYQEHFSDIWSPSGMQGFLNQDFSPTSLGKSLESWSTPIFRAGFSNCQLADIFSHSFSKISRGVHQIDAHSVTDVH